MPVQDNNRPSASRSNGRGGTEKERRNGDIDFILKQLSQLYPQIAKNLTTRVRTQKALTKDERKIHKIKLLHKENRSVFDELAKKLNDVHGVSRHPLGYSSSNFYESVFGLNDPEPVAGSYGSKYDFGQGPVEE